MARAVLDISNEGSRFAKHTENAFCHHFVSFFLIGADVVNLSWGTVLQDFQQGSNVVFNMNPVTDLSAVAVEWQRSVLQGIGDEQRQEFLRKLVSAIVVATSGNHDW